MSKEPLSEKQEEERYPYGLKDDNNLGSGTPERKITKPSVKEVEKKELQQGQHEPT